MLVDTELYNALNVTEVTSLLDSYLSTIALFTARKVPADFSANDSVNFYHIGPFNCALEYESYNYSINCRSNIESKSKQIAIACKNAINRINFSSCFAVVSVLETISPEDETDNYNTPLEVRIRK